MNASGLKAGGGKYKGLLDTLAGRQNSGRNRLNQGKKIIPRKKFTEGETYIQIIPACLALPFNPLDLQDDSFNGEHRFLFEGMSVYSGICALKAAMVANEELAQFMADTLGTDIEHLNLDNPEEVTDQEARMYMRWKTADIMAKDVQTLKFSDPRYKWGRMYAVDIERDENGDIVYNDKTPLSVLLCQMESALIAAQIARRNQELENGTLQDRAKDDISKKNDDAWRNRKIGNVHPYGTMRCIIIATDREFAPTKEAVSALSSANSLFPFECYTGINQKYLSEEIEAKAGTKKDRYLDFFAVTVECKTKQKPEETILEVAGRTTRNLCSTDEDFTQVLPNFVEKYRAFRDDAQLQKPEILEKSVINYRHIADSDLLQAMANDISVYEDVLRMPAIAEQYASLITQIDSQLGARLLSLSDSERTPGVSEAALKAELAAMPKPTAVDSEMCEIAGGSIPEAADLDALMNQLSGTVTETVPETPSPVVTPANAGNTAENAESTTSTKIEDVTVNTPVTAETNGSNVGTEAIVDDDSDELSRMLAGIPSV